jgi:hypothetical protein
MGREIHDIGPATWSSSSAAGPGRSANWPSHGETPHQRAHRHGWRHRDRETIIQASSRDQACVSDDEPKRLIDRLPVLPDHHFRKPSCFCDAAPGIMATVEFLEARGVTGSRPRRLKDNGSSWTRPYQALKALGLRNWGRSPRASVVAARGRARMTTTEGATHTSGTVAGRDNGGTPCCTSSNPPSRWRA